MAPGLATAIGQRQSRARRSRARDCLPRYEEPVLARFRLTLADASGKTDRPLTRTGTIGSPRKERPALARVQLTPVPATDESGKRCRRLSNSHGNAAMAELSPSMPSPATSPRLLRVRRPAWLPDMLAATLRKRRGRPPRPPVPNRSPVDGGWGWRRGAVTPKL